MAAFQILSILLSSQFPEDKMVCHLLKNVEYTIHSGYHMSELWQLLIPLKVKNFSWLAVHDILPTRSSLQR